jgi:hypothetical protein
MSNKYLDARRVPTGDRRCKDTCNSKCKGKSVGEGVYVQGQIPNKHTFRLRHVIHKSKAADRKQEHCIATRCDATGQSRGAPNGLRLGYSRGTSTNFVPAPLAQQKSGVIVKRRHETQTRAFERRCCQIHAFARLALHGHSLARIFLEKH